MTDDELLTQLNDLKNTMVSVATGGSAIKTVEWEFGNKFDVVEAELKRRRIDNPLSPYRDLWQWYGRWSSGDMPTYQSRRTYLSELFTPLVRRIKDNASTAPEPTRWERVDRTVDEMRARLAEANNEEQFQAVGLLGREALISLAQSVYDPQRHPAEYEGVKISATDAQRMLEVYFATDLAGGNNQEARAHAKSALKLALALQHRRTADFRHAALCVEATTSVINIVAIISGRRDPT